MNTNPPNIFFIRHLKTENNAKGIISGRSNSPIVSKDISFPENISFDCVISSPAERCINTLSELKNSGCILKNITFDERLLERNLGIFEGMLRTDAINQYPDLFIGKNLDVFSSPPEGESFNDFYNRASDFYNDINKMSDYENILFCSHNQTLKMLFHIFNKTEITNDSWKQLHFFNGDVVKI